MSFIIEDLAPDNKHDLQINGWNWRPTVELIRSFGIIASERAELIEIQGLGAAVTEAEAHAIGQKLRTMLVTLNDEQRVRRDLSITSEPWNPENPYEASVLWLRKFSDFCVKCKGFKIY